MKTTLILSILAFAATAATSPLPASSANSGTYQLATFDDLFSLPALSEINPLGTYKGLIWNSLNVLQAGVAGMNAVLPQSGINVAANGVTDTLTRGGVSITAAGSTKSFDFQSLYFGCVLNTVETLASAPEACTVAFTGYRKGSRQPHRTVNQSFDRTNAVVSKMVKASFDQEFAGLERVDVAVVSATATTALTGLLIDSVSYKTYTK